MNVPKLRFKEFKDEWNLTNIRNISSLVTKGTTPKKYEGNGINFVKVENIHDNLISNISSYISYDTHNKELKRSILKENDILFSIAGALGRTAIVKKSILPANTNQANAIIRIENLGNIDLYYLLNRLNHTDITNYINKCQSVGAQPNLSLEQVNNINISLPSINEQNKIGNMLFLLDKKIELQSKKIEDLKLFKKGLLKKNYYKIANNNLTELSCIANIYQPQTISQSELDNGKYYVFGANGIIGKYSKFNHKFMQVTISCRGENSGTINLTPDKCWITGNSMVLNVDENKNVDKLYLKSILEAQNLKYLISGSGQPQIVRSSVLKHKIPYISIEQQKKFTIPFIKLDSKIKLEQNKLIKLQKLKKGLMQRMFV